MLIVISGPVGPMGSWRGWCWLWMKEIRGLKCDEVDEGRKVVLLLLRDVAGGWGVKVSCA